MKNPANLLHLMNYIYFLDVRPDIKCLLTKSVEQISSVDEKTYSFLQLRLASVI